MASVADIADLTLDEMRLVLAPSVADGAVFDGWSPAAVQWAAEIHGIDPEVARLAFPGGAIDMVAGWIESIDAAMVLALPAAELAILPIRARIRKLVMFRLDAIAGREEALRRALA